MSQAVVTAGSAPLFLTKNYLNRDAYNAGGIVVSSGDAYKHRAYDMVRASQWVSVGSDDATDETYDFKLYEGHDQTSRSIDFVALLGVNLKNFLVEYSNDDGVTWSTVTGLDYQVGVADYAGTDKLVGLAAAVSANRVRITMYRTQTANAEKVLSDVVVGALQLQPTRGMRSYRKQFADSAKTVTMADGSTDYTLLYRADDGFEFFRTSLVFRGVTEAQRAYFRTLKVNPDPFVLFPEPGDVPADAFLCRIVPGSYEEEYLSLYRSAGWEVSFDVEEIGGA